MRGQAAGRRLQQWLRRTFVAPECPLAVLEVRAASLAYVRLSRERGQLRVAASAVLELPPGALAPSLVEANIQDRDRLRAALDGLLNRAGVPRGGRVALVLPDPVARVRSLEAGEIAAAPARDREELIRFRLKKMVPFDVRDAQLSFAATGPGKDAPLLVAAISRPVLEEYESLLEASGLHAGIVNLSGLAVLEFLAAEQATEDWLLVNWDESYVSFLLTLQGRPTLVRTLASSRQEVLREAASTALYYRERLSGPGLARVVVRASGLAPERAAELLAEPLGVRPEPLGFGDSGAFSAVPVTAAGGLACLLARAA